MSFVEALKVTNDNLSYTENGMAGYKSTGDPYIDFIYKISSLRPQNEKDSSFNDLLSNEGIEMFLSSLKEDQYPYLLKFLTYLRDPRHGLGERSLYRALLYKLFTEHKWGNMIQSFDALLDTMGKYGRYDDLIGTFFYDKSRPADTIPYFAQICERVKKQLLADMEAMKEGKSVSLLAKWLPSINTKGQQKLAKLVCQWLGYTPQQYRKTLSSLRAYLKVVEVSMSARKWEEINYETVPSKANLKYSKAFMLHDFERRQKFLENVQKGKAKINSAVNTPVDIVAAYCCKAQDQYDETLELLWKSLSSQKTPIESTLVVRDDSGSMISWCNSNVHITAYEVATALAIYCAQHNKGEYKDKLITFSMTPRYLDFSGCGSLLSILQYLSKHSEMANTNIRAVFQLVLKTAVEHNVPKEEMPKQILIISDMEFDQGTYFAGNPLEESAKEFEAHGYELPKLIFWNVCGRTNVVPMKQNKNGVFLLSGFSQNALDLALGDSSQKEQLLATLNANYTDIPLLKGPLLKATTSK